MSRNVTRIDNPGRGMTFRVTNLRQFEMHPVLVRIMKKTLWILFALSAVAIGFYPAMYFVIDPQFGLLSTKSNALLSNLYWNIGFYTHILAGGIALLIGWSQFSAALRTRYKSMHRALGKLYVIAAVLSGVAGLSIGFYATGGPIAATGFICLAMVWLGTTLKAYNYIRQGRVMKHEHLMLYSYAACFAAVTLRIWLPFLIMIFQDFIPAYRVVAWLSWVPNLLVVRLFFVPKLAINVS